MRRLIVFGCLAAALACRRETPPTLNSLAADYVRLAAAAEHPNADFRAQIGVARRGLLAAGEDGGRRAFLLAQLRALDRRARFLAGERVSIRQEALDLGLEPPTYDDARARALRAELDAALSGKGTLLERLAAERRANSVARGALDGLSQKLVSDCRARTPPPADLHDGGVEFRYVIDRPWPAFTSYRDNGVSVVEMRRDAAWVEDDLFAVLCHETYPGHHVQNLVWDDLRDRRGWIELGVMPMFTPHAVMAERLAVAATTLAVPRGSRPTVSRVLDDLAPLALAVAIATVDGEIPKTAGIDRLREDLLMPDAESFVKFVETYRSMAVAYVTPTPAVHDMASYLALLRSPAQLVAGAKQ